MPRFIDRFWLSQRQLDIIDILETHDIHRVYDSISPTESVTFYAYNEDNLIKARYTFYTKQPLDVILYTALKDKNTGKTISSNEANTAFAKRVFWDMFDRYQKQHTK